MNKNLRVVISALMISAKLGAPAFAAITPDQLSRIQSLTEANDISGLRAFLAANPQITQEDSPLSRELSKFLDSTDSVFERLFPGNAVTRLEQVVNIPDIY